MDTIIMQRVKAVKKLIVIILIVNYVFLKIQGNALFVKKVILYRMENVQIQEQMIILEQKKIYTD